MAVGTNNFAGYFELFSLFLAVPLLYFFRQIPIPMIPFLLLMFIGCLAVLLRCGDFDRKKLWIGGKAVSSAEIRRIAVEFAAAAALLFLFVWFFHPEKLFSFPRTHFKIWLAVIILYPLLSAYPQELIYRAYFFHRFSGIFRNTGSAIFASALAFSFMHIVFANWTAPALTLVGGFLFSRTYAGTGSLFYPWLEHSLYGNLVFTLGLGYYFHGATMAVVR